MMLVCGIFGSTAVHLVLEAIEVHGVRKYLALWHEYQGKPLGEALRGILMDEFKHEDVLVTELTNRKINPERIRNIFLGLNDGLVEILGAVSGFFGAFGSATDGLDRRVDHGRGRCPVDGRRFVLGVEQRERSEDDRDGKKIFLGEESDITPMEESPIGSAARGGDRLYYRRIGTGVAGLGRREGCLFSSSPPGSWSFWSRRSCRFYPAWTLNDASCSIWSLSPWRSA